MLKDKKNIWVVVSVVGIMLCFVAMPSLQNKSTQRTTPTEENTPSSPPPLIPLPSEDQLHTKNVYTNSNCFIISFGRGGEIQPKGVSRFLRGGTWNYSGVTWTYSLIEGKSWKIQGYHSGELNTFLGKYRSNHFLRDRPFGYIIGFATYVECHVY
jgi:hypothetical protein